MEVTKKCIFDGNLYTMEIPMTEDEYNIAMFNWKYKGQYIQEAFHMLNADEREFLLTGTPPEVWDKMFKEDSNV